MKTLELIVPCFNEEKCIAPFVEGVNKVLGRDTCNWSIIFVDDGSLDGTLAEIKKCKNTYSGTIGIKYISFARNFGKEAAMYAGLEHSTADYVAVMDVDLQHPPELLVEMLDILENDDFDCVGARRITRDGEPAIKSYFSRQFYYFINWATGIKLVHGMTDYRMMRRKVVEAIVAMTERERFTKGIYSWIGFKTKWIEYKNVERQHGTSKWSFRGLLGYAKSGFIAFATTPLRGVIYLGMLVVFASFLYAVKVLASVYSGVREWKDTTTIILLLLFLGGVIITVLGIVGEYIARIYMEAKGRPIYIERESNLE